MEKTSETVGQMWMRELSLVSVEGAGAAAFAQACKDVLALNPTLGMDQKALHFTAQGWLAAKNQVAVAA